ncbi:MAG TPA: hypothetical protein VM450_14185, partial [Thermomicrobiales bacterium]|nr:hypothetical protein [Thermomicrobiales bacterium]
MATISAEQGTLAHARRPSFLTILARGNRLGLVAGVVLLLFVVAAIAAPLIAPGDPVDMSPVDRLKSPAESGLMGTDVFGRDVFSRILY